MSATEGAMGGETVPGRAAVVPATTSNQVGGDGDGGFGGSSSGGTSHVNNLGADAKALTEVWLVAQSAADGEPVDTASARIEAPIPNWVRHVMYDAGSGQGAAEHLPAQLSVPVLIDRTSRRIVALDVDAVTAALEPYREHGVREWKETDAPLAGARQIAKLSGGMFRGLRKAFRDRGGDDEPAEPAAPTAAPYTGPHAAQHEAGMNLRASLAANPAQRDQMRPQVLQRGTTMARTVAAGTADANGFGAWLVFNESAGIVTPDEAANMRQIAGIA